FPDITPVRPETCAVARRGRGADRRRRGAGPLRGRGRVATAGEDGDEWDEGECLHEVKATPRSLVLEGAAGSPAASHPPCARCPSRVAAHRGFPANRRLSGLARALQCRPRMNTTTTFWKISMLATLTTLATLGCALDPQSSDED